MSQSIFLIEWQCIHSCMSHIILKIILLFVVWRFYGPSIHLVTQLKWSQNPMIIQYLMSLSERFFFKVFLQETEAHCFGICRYIENDCCQELFNRWLPRWESIVLLKAKIYEFTEKDFWASYEFPILLYVYCFIAISFTHIKFTPLKCKIKWFFIDLLSRTLSWIKELQRPNTVIKWFLRFNVKITEFKGSSHLTLQSMSIPCRGMEWGKTLFFVCDLSIYMILTCQFCLIIDWVRLCLKCSIPNCTLLGCLSYASIAHVF